MFSMCILTGVVNESFLFTLFRLAWTTFSFHVHRWYGTTLPTGAFKKSVLILSKIFENVKMCVLGTYGGGGGSKFIRIPFFSNRNF